LRRIGSRRNWHCQRHRTAILLLNYCRSERLLHLQLQHVLYILLPRSIVLQLCPTKVLMVLLLLLQGALYHR